MTTPDVFVDDINKRLIVRSYDKKLIKKLVVEWLDLSLSRKLEKIWLWSFPQDVSAFMEYGFALEGFLESNTLNKPSASLALYLLPKRGSTPQKKEEDIILLKSMSAPVKPLSQLSADYCIGFLNEANCEEISGLLKKVFLTYPTPMHDPEYVRKLIRNNCLFAGMYYKGKLVSIASAYLENDFSRYEMTDCATLEEFRGRSLTERLIKLLEKTIHDTSADCTFYSLARARSFGINRVFYKLGYCYRGRLVNNCHIQGQFEDMNLWVKFK